jgi:hypothetical protein
MALTITEALAEIKTINKRLEAKRNGLMPFLARQDGVRDPLEKDGGSLSFIVSERQAVGDLGKRVVALRRGIQKANDSTIVTINGASRTISEWLTWRREIAPGEQAFLGKLRSHINGLRENAKRQGAVLVGPGATAQAPTDFIINISESDLGAQIEGLEETLGVLDGQLSLKNATTIIEEK